jgi:hypothetical protein
MFGWAVFLAFILVGTVAVQGTVILFRPSPDSPSFGNYADLPLGCGSRVVMTNQDGFSYTLDGGETPNIVAQYNLENMPNICTWDDGFGDLVNVVTTGGDTRLFEYDLVADPGYAVRLISFDMATWAQDTPEASINSLSIQDGLGTNLYYQTNVFIPGAGHRTFSFANLTAPVLKIMFDASNVDADDVGLTDLMIQQVSTFQIISVTRQTNDINIRWSTEGGQTNIVQAASVPSGSFADISPPFVIAGTGSSTTNYVEVNGFQSGKTRFYRIKRLP